MSAAVLSHRGDIVWWLHRHIPDANYDLDTPLRSALITGDMVMAESLVSIAAQRGHLEIVRWIVEWTLQNHRTIDHGILVLTVVTLSIHTAAIHGHLEVAKYLRATASSSVCDGYTAHFTGDNLERLQRVGVEASPEAQRVSGKTLVLAAKKGFIDVVQWLYTEDGEDFQTDLFNAGQHRIPLDTIAMDTAAKYDHLDVLKYFHELQLSGETRLQCTENAMDGAAQNGHLSVVQYLHHNRAEGCTTAAMDQAAAHGYLDVVKWLHQYRTEDCTRAAMDGAALPGHLEVVQWLHENRAEGCSTRAMDNAATTGHLDMVKWLHLNRYVPKMRRSTRPSACCQMATCPSNRRLYRSMELFCF
ncbi:hypothetical protein AM587_10006429 [Phytophthora nicotianae]|uniref:Uncharacterized protein n=1 Tax=Phytophthora nicotianae TaxID=4792 RepID=A0A0W8DXW1_PHYNI|nr:hypothetical protein AM587_10006429 [Phytophthora nicotianae]